MLRGDRKEAPHTHLSRESHVFANARNFGCAHISVFFSHAKLQSERRQSTTPLFTHSISRHRPTPKMKFLKVGRVAIITRGRYAGKKVRLPYGDACTKRGGRKAIREGRRAVLGIPAFLAAHTTASPLLLQRSTIHGISTLAKDGADARATPIPGRDHPAH